MATSRTKNSQIRGFVGRVLAAAAVWLAPTLSAAETVAGATDPGPPPNPSGDASASGVAGASAPQRVDVTLYQGGVLVGQCVSPTGSPVPGVRIAATTRDGRRAVCVTGPDGGFGFRGVGGAVALEGSGDPLVVRAWAPGTAPPGSAEAVLLVYDESASGGEAELARGQHPAPPGTRSFVHRSKRLMANPLFVAGVVATAVAIPVAIHNASDDGPSS